MTQIIKPKVPENVLGMECRFAVYIDPPDRDMPDMHLIKENITYKDGTVKPNVKLVWDYKRPFWINKEGTRNYKQKKEWTEESNLLKYSTTQSKLVESINRAMKTPWIKGNLKKICSSPYIYGADILSTALIKNSYKVAFPSLQSKYSVAVFDTETDVLNGTGEIIMATITFKNTVFTAVVKDFIKGYSNVENRVGDMMNKYLDKYVEKRGLQQKLIIVDTPIDAIKACLDVAHKLKPDFLAIWSLDFDITKIIEACEKARVNPATLFSDPIVPKDYRYFNYIRGPKQKVTASGLVTSIKPPARWHTVVTPSSFYVVDAMCVYKHNRVGQPEKQSYSLDAILDEELGIRKLKFDLPGVTNETGLKWHQVMQTKYKLEYIIYNIFDCLSIEELDEKTLDLSLTFPMFSGISEFSKYTSQPRRTADRLHFHCLKHGKVMATTGEDKEGNFDDKVLGLSDWIITLPAHLVEDNGLTCIEEDPYLSTNARGHVADLDVSASYPNGQCVANVSKETTRKELTSIEGIELHKQMMSTINFSGGQTNAAEFCQTLMNFPSFPKLLDIIKQKEIVI
jgi:hypothetical protein